MTAREMIDQSQSDRARTATPAQDVALYVAGLLAAVVVYLTRGAA